MGVGGQKGNPTKQTLPPNSSEVSCSQVAQFRASAVRVPRNTNHALHYISLSLDCEVEKRAQEFAEPY